MKYIINFFLVLFSIFSVDLSAQQIPCDYIPLEFEEVKPLWTHLVIDSTFIGHTDTTEETGRYVQEYIDGMDQLGFDVHSFVDNDFLYSITNVDYDRDLAGYYIEKIDLDTGKKLWDIKTDLRHVDNREKILEVFVRDSVLVMYGVRTFWDELDLRTLNLETGFIPSYFFERIYSIESGELINFYTPEDSDSLAIELSSKNGSNYLIKIDENQYDYFNLNVSIYDGIFLERTIIDRFGHQISPLDTVLEYNYNDVDLTQVYQVSGKKLLKVSNYYYYMELLIPMEGSGLELQGLIYKYDLDFNLQKRIDLKELGINHFSRLSMSEVINDTIIITGCLNENPNSSCEQFYIFLDIDLNLLNTVEAKSNFELIGNFGIGNQDLNSRNELMAIDRTFLEDDNSHLVLFESNEEGMMDSIFKFTIKEENWVGSIEQLFLLKNDDVLAKITHSCYIDGRKNSWHPEWFRFKAEDINLISSIEAITPPQSIIKVYPNPTKSLVNISFEKPIDGLLEVYNSLGRKVFVQNINAHQNNIDINLENMASGYYVLKVLDRKGVILQTKKLVKI